MTSNDDLTLNKDHLERARLTCCAYAESTREATELMMMLGIHPSQEDDTHIVTPNPLQIPTNTTTYTSTARAKEGVAFKGYLKPWRGSS
jgi:hypothetical protein